MHWMCKKLRKKYTYNTDNIASLQYDTLQYDSTELDFLWEIKFALIYFKLNPYR